MATAPLFDAIEAAVLPEDKSRIVTRLTSERQSCGRGREHGEGLPRALYPITGNLLSAMVAAAMALSPAFVIANALSSDRFGSEAFGLDPARAVAAIGLQAAVTIRR